MHQHPRADSRLRRWRGPRPALALIAASAAVLGSVAAQGSAAARTSHVPIARAARTVSVSESAKLHRTGSGTSGITLNEEGAASGTIRGKIYIHLKLQQGNRVTAEVNIYPTGGSLSGAGSAKYSSVGGYANFNGSLSITRGTGTYRNARASGLRFTGSINRRTDATSVQLSGRLSY